MAKLTDKFFNRIIEGKLVADSGDELPKELPAVSGSDNGKALIVSGGKWQAGNISSGTKLYKHKITMDGAEIFFINANSTQYDYNSLKSEIVHLYNFISPYYNSVNYGSGPITAVGATSTTLYVTYMDSEEGLQSEELLASNYGTDTVTEL